MSYSAEISRRNPSCFVFLIDQSGSMKEPFSSYSGVSKAVAVAESINRFLMELILLCRDGPQVKDRHHVGVIGYGGTAKSLLRSTSTGRDLVTISEIAASPIRVENRVRKIDDGHGGHVEQSYKFPVWFDPQYGHTTVMEDALNLARRCVTEFLKEFPHCYPPIVINITDGKPHSDPEDAAETLRSLSSADGNVLLFNAHISDLTDGPIEFPSHSGCLPDKYARLLFRMSSQIPDPMVRLAMSSGYDLEHGARGMVFNAGITSVTRFIEFGTLTSGLHISPHQHRLEFGN